MGLLKQGEPLSWPELVKYLSYIKQQGTIQFSKLYNATKDHQSPNFRFGDEMEYQIVYMPNNEPGIVKVLLRGHEVIADVKTKASKLQEMIESGQIKPETLELSENKNDNSARDNNELEIGTKLIIMPEYGSFQLETTPFYPFNNSFGSLLSIETSMLYRRHWIESVLNKNKEKLISTCFFPTLGVGKYCEPFYEPSGKTSKLLCDKVCNPHVRHNTIKKNMTVRRQRPHEYKLPVFKDKNTDFNDEAVLDDIGFAITNCALHTTVQAFDLKEAKYLYDTFAILCPLLLAVTAAGPFVNGKICDFDAHYILSGQLQDDRTPTELNNPKMRPRYGSIPMFINNHVSDIETNVNQTDTTTDDNIMNRYNDVEVKINEESFDYLTKNNSDMDSLLARHVSYLFSRDHWIVYRDQIDQKTNDEKNNAKNNEKNIETTEFFDLILASNYLTVRLKPPPLPKVNQDSNNIIGWRVEVRAMEIQFSEFENAAFVMFVALLAKALVYYKCNYYMPISKVDINLELGQTPLALKNKQLKFWFRNQVNGRCEEMTIEDIFFDNCKPNNGQNMGIMCVVKQYLSDVKLYSKQEINKINEYLDFISMRIKGELMTPAEYMRYIVSNSKLYNHDSNINEALTREIYDNIEKITKGVLHEPLLLPKNINIYERRKERLNSNILNLIDNAVTIEKEKTNDETKIVYKDGNSEEKQEITNQNKDKNLKDRDDGAVIVYDIQDKTSKVETTAATEGSEKSQKSWSLRSMFCCCGK